MILTKNEEERYAFSRSLELENQKKARFNQKVQKYNSFTL
jgi:hypothetical protein